MADNTRPAGELSLEEAAAIFFSILGVFIVHLIQGNTGLTYLQAVILLGFVVLLLAAFGFSLPGQWRMLRAKWYGWRINQHHRKQSPFTKTVGRRVVTHLVQLVEEGRAWVQSAVTRESESQSADDEPPTDTEDK
jgi:hypothetical protein